MNDQLLTELKEYCFSLYIGQKVAFPIYAKTIKDCSIVTPDSAHFTEPIRWVLQLRSLSSITDDEAIEVAKIMGLSNGDFAISRTDEDGEPLLILDADEQRLAIYYNTCSVYFHDFDSMYSLEGVNHLYAYQYLQQQGFALPIYFKGVQYSVEKLIELNIIQLHP